MIVLGIFAHIVIATIFLVIFCRTCDEMVLAFHSRGWRSKLMVVTVLLAAAYLWEITILVVATVKYFTKDKE